MASEEPTKRDGVTFELTPQARAALDRLVNRNGMVQKIAVQRVFEWFTSLDESMQDAAILLNGDAQRAAMIAGLHRLLHRDVADLDFEGLIATMRNTVEEIASRHRTAVRVAKSMNESAERKKK